MSSKFYRNLSIIIAVLGGLTGIGAGFIFKSIGFKFNFILMFSYWIATAILDFLYIGIYEIMLNQELIYKKLHEISNSDKIEEKKSQNPNSVFKNINI